LHLAGQVAELVVAVAGAAAAVVHAGQAANGERLRRGALGLDGVVAIGDVQAGVAVADAGQAVEGVVAVAGQLTSGVEHAGAVAGTVVAVGRDAGVRAFQLGQIAEGVVGVLGAQTLGVNDFGQVVLGIVVKPGLGVDATDVLQGPAEPVQRIVVVVGDATQRVGGGIKVAAGIVSEPGCVTSGVFGRLQLAQLVIDARQGALEGVVAALDLFLDAVPGVIQGVMDSVTFGIDDVDQA
jgi:hypothetical protein